MNINLSGKVALVTGGNSGIGRAIAVALAECGAQVAFTYYSTESEGTEKEIRALGGRAIKRYLDATDSGMVASVVDEIAESYDGHIDILINNAGYLVDRCPIIEMEDQLWNEVIDVNLNSAFYVTRSVLPYMNRDWGRLISISSLAAHGGGGGGNSIPYAVAKAGLVAFMKGLAIEVAGRGITANSVLPGLIVDTPWHAKFTSQDSIDRRVSQTPLKRAGLPADVVGAVLYLASEMASFVTGEEINVNGGRWFP